VLKKEALGGAVKGEVRIKYGRVRITAELGGSDAYLYSDVYLGLDGDLHLPLDGKAKIKGKVVSIRHFAKKLLDEYCYRAKCDLKELIEKKKERLLNGAPSDVKDGGSQSRKSESAKKSSSSSLSRSSQSLWYSCPPSLRDEFWGLFCLPMSSLCSLFETDKSLVFSTDLTLGEAVRFIDSLFFAPPYWGDSRELSSVARTLLECGECYQAFLENLASAGISEGNACYDFVKYVLDRIQNELESILEEAL